MYKITLASERLALLESPMVHTARLRQRNRTLVEIEELCTRHPSKRFYPILREMLRLTLHPHEGFTEAIHRMWKTDRLPTRRTISFHNAIYKDIPCITTR
jgi:hypothetical protein